MRKNILLPLIIVSLVLSAGFSTASAYDKASQDCGKCHTLTPDQAAETLKSVIPDIKVLEVKPGPLLGIWEIDLLAQGKKGLLYLDYSKQKIFNGAVFGIKDRRNYTEESFSQLNRVDAASISLDNSLVLGDKNARIRIIVFSDPDCPYCGKLHQAMKQVLEKRKDIAFYIKLYPLPMHKDAYAKAKAIVCENSLSLLDDAFAGKELPKPKCETAVVDDNIKLAQSLGISGTPALIYPDGTLVPGFIDADKIISTLDKNKK